MRAFRPLCRQGLASAAAVALNVAANPFGDAAIAAMSIVTRYMMFINSALIGFGQGFQPVCGFNFGAKRYDRVLESFWFCLKVAVTLLTTLGVVEVFRGRGHYGRVPEGDLEVIRIGTWAMRFQCLTLPFQAWIIMSNMLTQSIGYGFRASIVAAGRQDLSDPVPPYASPFPGDPGAAALPAHCGCLHQRHGRGDRRLHTEGVKGLERRNEKIYRKKLWTNEEIL